MAYVEIIKRNKKEYFYLTKNIRLGLNKWKKVRIYLGDKQPTKEELAQSTKKIELDSQQFIKKSEYAYLSEHDAETLQDLKESYKEWLKQIPKSVREKLNEDFVIRFTYHTNAIEGNRLTLRQTALILKDKVIPSGVRAEDYNEAINGKECLDYINAGLAEKLKEIGFYPMQKSVFIHPYECKDEIDFITEIFNLSPYVRFLRVNNTDIDLDLKNKFRLI